MSIDALRAELRAAGVADATQPDDGTLQVLLDVEGGVEGARAAVLASVAAERTDSGPHPVAVRHEQPPAAGVPSWLHLFLRALSLPFSLLHALIAFVFRAFRTPRADLTRFAEDPREAARRFVDSVERDAHGTTLRGTHNAALAQLPPFLPESYSDALQLAKHEHRILAVILSSRVHADDAYFRSQVLTDRRLVDALSTRDFVVWGGCVQDREAHRVSALLEASTYPFVAFIALQPRRSRTSPIITSKAAVLSRIEGSPRHATSAGMLVAHIHDVLLPRTLPYLERLRAERRRRESERALMAEQDRAYEETARRDAARVLNARAESERAARLARTREAEAAAAVAAAARAPQWRRWAKQRLVPPEPEAGAPAVRLSIHVPDGRNLQRRFRPSDTLESVYIYVETAGEPDGGGDAPPADYTPQYGFRLVQTYPRVELGHALMARTLGSLEALGAGAHLLAEGCVGGHVPSSSSEMEA